MNRPTNLKVGDLFKVIEENDYFDVGEIITLKKDDHTENPRFWNENKSNSRYINFSKLEPHIKTVRDAQVDDIVIGKSIGCEFMVLERGRRTVLLSCGNDFKNSLGNHTFDRLEEDFTLKDAPVEQTILTMDQIAEKFGVDVSNLKIAKE